MLRLHPLLRDRAVVQADVPLLVCGTALPHVAVAVSVGDRRLCAVADDAGRWSIEAPAIPAGTRFDLSITSGNECVRASDLVAGDVWLCAGQSNMEWELKRLPHARDDIESANDPDIRFFHVDHARAPRPIDTAGGEWRPGTRDHVGDCSAVAWYFARKIRRYTDRPIGVVISCVGGTSILSWMPNEILSRRSAYAECVADLEKIRPPKKSVNPHPHPFLLRSAHTQDWESPSFDDRMWATLRVPGQWQRQGWRFNGAVWYRTRVRLPEEWIGRTLTLNLGIVDDFDEAFVNGERVGGHGPENPLAYKTPRVYAVRKELTQTGVLVIAVRVFDQWGEGGILSPGWLSPEDDPACALPLPSLWFARAEQELPWRMGWVPPAPSELYNAMLHPLAPYPLRGALWYQGESDVRRARFYRDLLADFINGLRAAWRNPHLPICVVQLAGYMPTVPFPMESDWAELRDAQWRVARELPNVGLISAIDVGDPFDFHPLQKQPVGERLADWALSTQYGRADHPWRHPEFQSMDTAATYVRIRVAHAQGTLRTIDGQPPRGFELAGPNCVWLRADADIVNGACIVVRHPSISTPIGARYAWQANPDANVVGGHGLPLLPFRVPCP